MNRAWKISVDTGKAQSHSRSGTTMACLCEPVQPLSRSWTENFSKTFWNLKENGKQFLSNFISISKGRSVLGISQTWNTCISTFKLVFMIKCNLVIPGPESPAGWDKRKKELNLDESTNLVTIVLNSSLICSDTGTITDNKIRLEFWVLLWVLLWIFITRDWFA